MMTIKTITASSSNPNPNIASQEIAAKLNQHNICFVLFYCSASYELVALGQALESHLNTVTVAGCTSSGEITEVGYQQQCIVAVGFSAEHFSINVELVESLSRFDLKDAQTTMTSLIEQCRKNKVAPITSHSFLFTLLDGLSVEEEQFLSVLHSAAGGIAHFGGSAGDDSMLAQTCVYYRGKFYQQAAIVMLINTNLPFEVFSSNHIETPGQKLVVTDAASEQRVVYELNAEPAAIEYARLLNLSVEELNPKVFSVNPLAVKVGGQYFIRSIQKVNKIDNSLAFYCAVDDGIVLTMVELGDVFEVLNQKLAALAQRYGEQEIVLGCDCILRRLEIEQLSGTEQVNRLFKKYHIIGFNAYGEHINGIHMNQTFTGVYIARGSDE